MSQRRQIEGVYGDIVVHFVEVDKSQICNRKYNRFRLYNTETQTLGGSKDIFDGLL
jgi:hypothetical protein